jgi:hypothetical protein
MRSRLRDRPEWREMFARLRAKQAAARRTEADRWRSLSEAEKWAEMSACVRRWRGLTARDAATVAESILRQALE